MRILLDPNAPPSGGGQIVPNPVPAAPTPPPTGDPGSVGGTGTSPQPAAPTFAPSPSPQPGLTKEDIAAAVASAVQTTQRQNQPVAPQMTQEEIDRALRVFRPTAKQVEALREGGENALGALNEIVAGVYQQATTMSAYQMQLQMEKIQGILNPVHTYVQQQQMAALKNEFFTEHPDLKGLDPLLASIKDQIVQEGKTFSDKKLAFAEVATRARALMKSLPGMTPAGAAASVAATGTPPSNMSTQIGGGQGGAAGGGTPASAGGSLPNWRALGD